jgi:hypothetical protein
MYTSGLGVVGEVFQVEWTSAKVWRTGKGRGADYTVESKWMISRG